jgi:hypothetical protein
MPTPHHDNIEAIEKVRGFRREMQGNHRSKALGLILAIKLRRRSAVALLR